MRQNPNARRDENANEVCVALAGNGRSDASVTQCCGYGVPRGVPLPLHPAGG